MDAAACRGLSWEPSGKCMYICMYSFVCLEKTCFPVLVLRLALSGSVCLEERASVLSWALLQSKPTICVGGVGLPAHQILPTYLLHIRGT